MLTAGSVVAKGCAQLVLKYKYYVVNEVLWLWRPTIFFLICWPLLNSAKQSFGSIFSFAAYCWVHKRTLQMSGSRWKSSKTNNLNCILLIFYHYLWSVPEYADWLHQFHLWRARPETFGKELELKHGSFVHNLFFNEHFRYFCFLKCHAAYRNFSVIGEAFKKDRCLFWLITVQSFTKLISFRLIYHHRL